MTKKTFHTNADLVIVTEKTLNFLQRATSSSHRRRFYVNITLAENRSGCKYFLNRTQHMRYVHDNKDIFLHIKIYVHRKTCSRQGSIELESLQSRVWRVTAIRVRSGRKSASFIFFYFYFFIILFYFFN